MLFKLENISKSYDKPILKNVSWQFNAGNKLALVGRNGVGKTTLFEIILGTVKPDSGAVEYLKGTTFSYFSQTFKLSEDSNVMETALRASSVLNELKNSMTELETRISGEERKGEMEKLASRYSSLQEEFMRKGGYEFPSRCEDVLTGLGFDGADFDLNVGQLSGGQKSRLALALVILKDSTVLLMDEPTNHLDFSAISWLEEYLKNTEKSFIVVSHDKYFMDNIARGVIELENAKLTEYTGNFTSYREQKAQRLELEEKKYEEQQEFIKKTEDFIQKNLAGQKTKQAQSRRKMLKKLDRYEKPKTDESSYNFNFEEAARGGNIVVKLEDLSVGYPGKELLSHIDLIVQRGEKLGLVGPNGTGKTTLLRTVAGRLEQLSGKVDYGSGINTGYFDQELKILDEERAVLDQLRDDHPDAKMEYFRGYLGRFGFSGDDIFRYVRSLSGGEKSRLSLAKIIARGHNFLLLDEPTNHLDIQNRESLIQSLKEYPGSIIFVTHDRFFLDSLSEKMLIIRDGTVETRYWSFSQYSDEFIRKEKEIREKQRRQKRSRKKRDSRDTGKKEKREREARVKEIETMITSLEREIEDIDRLIKSPWEQLNPDNIKEQERRRNGLEKEIDRLYREWEESAPE